MKKANNGAAMWVLCLGGIGVAVACNAARQSAVSATLAAVPAGTSVDAQTQSVANKDEPKVQEIVFSGKLHRSQFSNLMVRDVPQAAAPKVAAPKVAAPLKGSAASVYRIPGKPAPQRPAHANSYTRSVDTTPHKGKSVAGGIIKRFDPRRAPLSSAHRNAKGNWRID